ncbi:MAG: sigma-E processing peptidase SpoIIGA [Clostridia bacterium]|nr:sigma-E processing peptidase SpoIIGA [Clostridia bacterium]
MKREIFVDSYVIVNSLMNWACLYTASGLAGIAPKKLRLILASLIGSGFAVIVSAFSIPPVLTIFLWVFTGAFMCFAAFGRLSPKRFSVLLTVTLVCGFACGGLAEGLLNLAAGFGANTKITLSVLIVAVTLLVTVFRFCGELTKSRLETVCATVRIEAFGKSKRMLGLCDSGNLLKEPISGWPVIIVGYGEAKGFIPDEYFGGSIVASNNLFAVPVSSVGGKKIIYGFIPQSIVISGAGRKRKRTLDEIIVAVDADTELFGGCGCLVPANLL